MKQKTLTSLSVATALGLLTPLTGYAFGLGQITLHSALNEPFRAEIAVNALRDDERGNLEVRLASTQDFERAGLDRNFLLTQLSFEVVEEANSTRIIVTSDVPIKEPFLGFLVAATTGQGKLLREYTVLLDPPKELYRDRVSSVPSRSTTTPQPTPAVSRSQPSVSTPVGAGVTEYKVQSRDTLWSIAERTRPSADITMQQMMLALLNTNPRAFQQNNVNTLYAGSTLRIPSGEEINRLSASEANAEVDRQNNVWKNRNRAVTTAPALEAGTSSPTTDSPVDAENETQANDIADDATSPIEAEETASSEESARLKLIAANENTLLDADPDINGDPDLQKISEQLTLAQETIEAQSQENIDFKNRMDALERQLETMRRLISLKDADMARLQNLLEQGETQMDLATLVDEANAILEGSETDNESIGAASEDTTDLADVYDEWEPVPVESGEDLSESATGELTPGSNDVLSPTALDNEALNDTTDVEQAETELEQNRDITQSDANPDTEQLDTQSEANNEDVTQLESSSAEVDAAIDEAALMLDLDEQQMDSLYQRVQAFVITHKVESLLAVLLLLLIIWMIIRRGQREVSWNDAVSKINKDKPAKTTPETGSVNIVSPVLDETKASPENKTKSVDELVEQAEMFVGYADYVQARTALEQAHQQAPADKDIAAKLMFVYYKQQKSADFIALLNTSGIDESYPQWPEIRVWGNQLLPHNPLFAEEVESHDEAHIMEDISDEPETESKDDEVLDKEAMLEDTEAEESDHIEFNLDDYQTDSVKASPVDQVYKRDDEELLQFESNSVSAEKQTGIEPEEPEISAFAEDDDLRIDLDQDNVLQPDSSAPEILDFNIDEPEDAAELVVTEEPEETLSLDSMDSDELDLSAFETEDPISTETDDVIEDYLNLDNNLDDEELDFDLSDFDSIDEAETKLDLAEAYSDMGDPEGARGILEEVLEQGTDEQKKRAQQLLDSLS